MANLSFVCSIARFCSVAVVCDEVGGHSLHLLYCQYCVFVCGIPDHRVIFRNGSYHGDVCKVFAFSGGSRPRVRIISHIW